jgi:hypothetical protein
MTEEHPLLQEEILSSARAYRIGSRKSLSEHAKQIKAKAGAEGIEVSGKALRRSILAARPELGGPTGEETKFRTADVKPVKPLKEKAVRATDDERRIRREEAIARRKALKAAGVLPARKPSLRSGATGKPVQKDDLLSLRTDLPDPVQVEEGNSGDVRRRRRETANLQREERTAAELRPLLECFVMTQRDR